MSTSILSSPVWGTTRTRLFKVVTISIHRTCQTIEAHNEAEALELAHQMSRPGPMIDRRSVVTVSIPGRGGVCHV